MFQCVLLRICVVVTIAVVFVGSNCFEKIRELERRVGNNRPVMGGITRIASPEQDAIVKNIVAQGVKEFNERSVDLLHFKSNGNIEAYTKLVNGLKFCVQFYLTSSGCKNSLSGDFCHRREGQKCVVSAYKPFDAKTATIDHNSLSCVGVE